jgi:hypothetical protein
VTVFGRLCTTAIVQHRKVGCKRCKRV